MKFPDQSSNSAHEPTDEELNQLAIDRVWQLLESSCSSPNLFSVAQLRLSIQMTVALAPSSIRPRAAVDKVLAPLSVEEIKSMRNSLLRFYASEGDLAEAAKYLPENGKAAVSEYYPAMQVCLATGNMEAAEVLARLCVKRIPWSRRYPGGFLQYGLHMALASYYAYVGERRKAVQFWAYSTPTDYWFAEAASGLVCALIVETIAGAHRGINELLDQQENEHFIFDAVAATDALERRSHTVEALQKIRDGLLEVLPPDQKARFGFQADALFKPTENKEGE